MKKVLIIIFVSTVLSSNVFAQEEVILLPKETMKLKVPNSTSQIIIDANKNKEDESYLYKDYAENIDSNDELFEGKFGKLFNKIIDEKAINNKVNKLLMDDNY